MRTAHANQAEKIPATSLTIASNAEDAKAAFRLIYNAYLRSGLIPANRHALRVTPYHLLSTSDILVAKKHGEVACTLTVVRDGRLGLPMESVFGPEVAERRERNVKIAEVSCLADRRQDQERTFPLLSKLMSFTAQYATHRGIEELLIAIHPRHAGFYEKFLGFEVINDHEQSYDAVSGNPAVALSLDLIRLQMSATPAYRRLYGRPFPTHSFRHPSLEGELLSELASIVEETYPAEKLLDEADTEQGPPQVIPMQNIESHSSLAVGPVA